MIVDRRELDRRIASVRAWGPHRPSHIRRVVDAVLARPRPGVLVECGAYQGVSAAKLSHLAAMLGRELVVCDSFQGLPPNVEPHTRTYRGRDVRGALGAGAYAGSLAEVQSTIARYGVPDVVRYLPGWFADTLPGWSYGPIAGVYLDVDLASSATTCLTHLWPHVSPGGVIVSQDGHLPVTVAAMRRWVETAEPRPIVTGLGDRMMVVLRKPPGLRRRGRRGGGRGRGLRRR